MGIRIEPDIRMRTGRATFRLLQQAVEEQYQCRARFREAVAVSETHSGQVVWRELVHVFDLHGRPPAPRCYAWEEIWGVVTMLHRGLVDSPGESVRFAGAARRRLAAPQ